MYNAILFALVILVTSVTSVTADGNFDASDVMSGTIVSDGFSDEVDTYSEAIIDAYGYNSTEVYTKLETYNTAEIDTKVNLMVNTSEVRVIIDDYSYNSTEVYTKLEIGSLALNDLDDVDVSSPDDNDVLTYDTSTSSWTSEAASSGSKTTVEIESIVDDYSYNSTEIYTITEVDATIEAAISGGTGKTTAEIEIIISQANLDDLHSVEVSSPDDNDVLTYDATTQTWASEAGGGGGTNSFTTIEVTGTSEIANLNIFADYGGTSDTTALSRRDSTDAVFPSVFLGTSSVGIGVVDIEHFLTEYNANAITITTSEVSIACLEGIGADSAAITINKTAVSSTNFYPSTNDTYYLGKNDDDSPFAWKGLILKDTTDGKYYRIEVISGVITATDLTD